MSATQRGSTSGGYLPHLLLSVARRSTTRSKSKAIGLALPVARLAQVRGGLVGEHALDLADPRDDGGDACAGLAREALIGHGLDELADPQAPGVSRRAAGRQDVIRPEGLVGIGHGGLLAHEQRAVVPEASDVPVVPPRLHLEVLGRVLIGDLRRLLVGADDDDLAVVLPGLPGNLP